MEFAGQVAAQGELNCLSLNVEYLVGYLPLQRPPKRLQRMMLRLQHFDFEVQYKQGPLMFLADTLSRATTPMGKTDETIGTSHVMQLHSIRSTTEIEVAESGKFTGICATGVTFGEGN